MLSMSESGPYNLGPRLDIKQILSEAKHRWLRPTEVSEILRTYGMFHISPEAPNKPVSGSVFLFDRKVLRYFRKDGHNWRKKKDGKTVKEAHEKLKVGSVEMLNCYYAHGEDDEKFQRRSYWLLEQDLMHIVFVHYLEVKINRTNINSANGARVVSNSENDNSLSSRFRGTSPTSTLSSASSYAESEVNQQSSRFNSYPHSPLIEDSHFARSSSYTQCYHLGNHNVSASETVILGSSQEVLGNPTIGEATYKHDPRSPFPVHAKWEVSNNSYSGQWNEAIPFYTFPVQEEQLGQRNIQMLLSDAEMGIVMNPDLDSSMKAVGSENYPFLFKRPMGNLQTKKSLKKVDSFKLWVAKQLGDVDELDIQLGKCDSNLSAQVQVDTLTVNPSISLDENFRITNFLPKWAYSNLETKVLITGVFLKSEEELSKCRWSIMFGESEVPAEVLGDGILCCSAPLHDPGHVPIYITCSNRLACTEVREFEYRFGPDQNIGFVDVNGDSAIMMHLYQRLEMILCVERVGSRADSIGNIGNNYEKQIVINKINSLIEDENYKETKLTSRSKVIGELLLEKKVKEKFYSWLLHRVNADEKGLTIIDERGQNVLHLAAALGFNWAFQPIIVSGVSINFRDVNGRTALHWAALYGREETVAALVSLGAAPGALTDPSTEYPQGRTPSDLAYSSGHKGISGFLGETFLTTHLSTLRMKDGDITKESVLKEVHTVTERLAVPKTEEDVPDTLSLKDSIAAVCNATQAAARIQQIFRFESFESKQLIIERASDELMAPVEYAISLAPAKTAKTPRVGRLDGKGNVAALQIQKKYRGWKKRKEFLLIRQKIVKIQAHVRGHHVRKKYKTIIWSVGILEKVILRWRRKGTGLRGFRSDGAAQKGLDRQETLPPLEDDYDYLKEGRKQTEDRMHKALSRVKSMAQYPDARAQYRRLLNAAQGFRETKDASDAIPHSMEDLIYPGDDLIDVESLMDDDTFMSLAF